MLLTENELAKEQLVQLRRLEQSPGWGLLKARLQELVTFKEREKSSLLREGKSNEAVISQAKVDGMNDILTTLDKMISALQSKQESQPIY